MSQLITGRVVDVYPFRIVQGRPEYLALLRSPSSHLGETWEAVHGALNRRETSARAASRSLHERTGLIPEVLWNLDYVHHLYAPEEDAVYVVPAFAVQAPMGAIVELTPEHVSWDWLTLDEALHRFLWFGQRTALRTLHEEIATPLAEGTIPNPHQQIAPELWDPARGKR